MVAAILVILASATFPVAKFTSRRIKETELRHDLRTMRHAIDEYKRYSDAGLIPVDLGTDGYPKELEILVEGVELVGQVDKKVKLPAPHPRRPDDRRGGVGPAQLPGRSRLDLLGRRERLRRLLPVRAASASMASPTGNGERHGNDARLEETAAAAESGAPRAASRCSS